MTRAFVFFYWLFVGLLFLLLLCCSMNMIRSAAAMYASVCRTPNGHDAREYTYNVYTARQPTTTDGDG
jgi:hypothetical protein